MTDKEKIKAELERRMYDDYNSGEAEEDCVAQCVCASMIQFIDSLQEEPVSDNLEKAAYNYTLNVRKGYPRVMDETDRYIYNAFKAGSNWQKQQMEFERGYRKALEDAWEFFGKGFPNDCRILVKQFFDKEMEQKLKELSQG